MIDDKFLNCVEMFQHACGFCDCANLSFEKGLYGGNSGFLLVPVGVNSAFACEVFLKILLKIHNVDNKKSHNLKSLFELLPDKLKNSIKTHLQNCHLWKDALGQENLDIISNAFNSWRYIYEHDFRNGGTVWIDCGFLNIFRDLLREICCKQLFNRTWEEYQKGYSNGRK